MNQPRTQRGPHSLTRALGALLLCALLIASLTRPCARRPTRSPRRRTSSARSASTSGRAIWPSPSPAASSRSRSSSTASWKTPPSTSRGPCRSRWPPAMSTRSTGPALRWARSTWPSRATWSPPRRRPPLYDDGWFGYGKFVPPTPPKPTTLQPSKTLGVINGIDEDDDRPHFSARSAQPGSGDAATPTAGAPASSTGTPASDPDRPTLHRTTSTSDQTASTGSGETPANDPDRPTLRRHSPQDAGKNTSAISPAAAAASPR